MFFFYTNGSDDMQVSIDTVRLVKHWFGLASPCRNSKDHSEVDVFRFPDYIILKNPIVLLMV